MFVTYPEASFTKKMIILGALLIVCAAIILITLSLFESLTEVVKLEDEVKEILEDEKHDTKSVENNV